MRNKFKLAASSFAMAAAFLTMTGCKTQPDHPNQVNTFDGGTYDTLTLAHGALESLRVQVQGTYPQYAATFNQAAAAYSTAFDAYSLYRSAATATSQAQVSVEIGNLAVSLVVLENAFEADLHVSTATDAAIRAKAGRIRAAAGTDVSVADILTELEIAAAIAESIPQAKPYAALAAMVIAATNEALSSEAAQAGQPIDLSTIQPLATIQ